MTTLLYLMACLMSRAPLINLAESRDTGMQWKCLPIPQDAQGKPAIHYTTVYKVFLRRNNSLHTPGYQDRLRRIS